MKINFLTGLLCAFCITLMINKAAVAQTVGVQGIATYEHPVYVDGNDLIKQLLNDRYQYNKRLIKHVNGETVQLPKPQSIIGAKSIITFNGYDYIVVNKQVVEVKGIALSNHALVMLNSKLNLLDHFQQACANQVNAEYAQTNRNLQYIKTLDRQFFSALNQFTDLTQNIAHLGKKPNSSITIELALQKVEVPSIDILTVKDKQIMVAEVIKK